MRTVVLASLLAALTASCGSQPKEEDYPAKIATIRAAKDESFKSDPDSPIPPDKKSALLPLAYFPIDETYAVPATLEPSADRSRIEVPTSIGIYVVDFNVAYNPYCYYSPEYDCPFPPKENRLDVPIRAGEKMQKADSSIP